MTIIPLPRTAAQHRRPLDASVLDVGPLAAVLAQMEPEVLAVILPGETIEDAHARRAAGLDILGELLNEFGGEYDDAVALEAITVLVDADTLDTSDDLLIGGAA